MIKLSLMAAVIGCALLMVGCKGGSGVFPDEPSYRFRKIDNSSNLTFVKNNHGHDTSGTITQQGEIVEWIAPYGTQFIIDPSAEAENCVQNGTQKVCRVPKNHRNTTELKMELEPRLKHHLQKQGKTQASPQPSASERIG